MGRTNLVLFAMVLTLAGCSSSPTEPSEPVAVTLAPGASGMVGALRLTFVRITGDSRCPGDAICITAGDAQAAIESSFLGSSQFAELWLFDGDKRTVTHAGYTISFDILTPYPFASQGPIPPSAYRATFSVKRR